MSWYLIVIALVSFFCGIIYGCFFIINSYQENEDEI